jgi:hypothetical protein
LILFVQPDAVKEIVTCVLQKVLEFFFSCGICENPSGAPGKNSSCKMSVSQQQFDRILYIELGCQECPLVFSLVASKMLKLGVRLVNSKLLKVIAIDLEHKLVE